MRTSLRFLLAASLVAAATSASAQTPIFGLTTTPDCMTVLLNDVENAELFAVKVSNSGACTDILFDLRQTSGLSVGGATTGDSINQQWSVPQNWRVPQVPTDAHFIFLVYPPATGAGNRANRMMIDSGTIGNQDFAAAPTQTVGNSLPSSYNSIGGSTTQGIDLVLTSATPYTVKLRGSAQPVDPRTFPAGANGGIEVAFAPLAEVQTTDVLGPGGGCQIAGETRNPSAPADPQVDGAIVGYNAYRLVGTAGTTPTAQDFYNASTNNDPTDGWQYYMPLTQSYNLGLPDTTPGGPGTPAPSDLNPNDLGGLQNVDGTMYSGDEVMIYQDSGANRGTNRPANNGSAPVPGTGYWYAFQPVMCGSIGDFSAPMGWGSSGALVGDHSLSVSTLAAGDDALDLDLDGNIEFFSPQVDAGVATGLGMTYNGFPVITQPVFGQMDLAAAGGTVTLSGRLEGQNVNLTFQTSLEAGDVQSFNVYRGVADARVRVNVQPILAQGTESSVYQLVDDAVQARRLSKSGTIQYSVETVYTDGHTTMVGPFAVTLERQAPGRRSR